MPDFFRTPGLRYNFVSFGFSALGLGLGIWALILAYAQLGKTLRAAQAAKDASEATTHKLGRITALVDVQKLCALAREATTCIRLGSLEEAARPVHELRLGLASLRMSVEGKDLRRSTQWDWMIAGLSEIENMLGRAQTDTDVERAKIECASSFAVIEEKIYEMASGAIRIDGD